MDCQQIRSLKARLNFAMEQLNCTPMNDPQMLEIHLKNVNELSFELSMEIRASHEYLYDIDDLEKGERYSFPSSDHEETYIINEGHAYVIYGLDLNDDKTILGRYDTFAEAHANGEENALSNILGDV